MKVLLIALGAIVAMGATLAPLAQAQTPPAKAEVWNTGKVYHCPGTRWFKATKTGSLMTEQAAAQAGAKGARGKTCAEVAAAATEKRKEVKPPKA